MRRRGRLGRWAAEVILAYNQPSFLACLAEDSIEQQAWEDALDYMVDEGMEAHDFCNEKGYEYPPPEFWEMWRRKRVNK